MTDKEYDCAYKYCLHHGQKVKNSESVVINKKHYHWDCAQMKQDIKDCADLYVEHTGDKTQYPAAIKVISTMVSNNRVPVDFIRENIKNSKNYYVGKPVYVLYGLRKLYWQQGMK